MKTYKWFFLVLVSGILFSCGGTSEEELVGDWQRRAVFSGSGRSFAATFVIGNKGYVCGGWNGQKVRRKDAYVFDHTGGGGKGSWWQVNDFPGAGRSHAVGFSIGDYGYVGTGWDGDETDMKDFWRYDPNHYDSEGEEIGEWTEVAPLPEKAYPRRGALAFSLTVGGKEYGYVGFGFYDGPLDRLFLNDIWQFDPDGTTTVTAEVEGVQVTRTLPGRWTAVTGYGGDKREGATAFVIDNKAYISSGKSSSYPVNEFWVYDPNGAASEREAWSTDPPRKMSDSNPDEDYDDDYGGLARSYGVAYVASVGGQLRGHIVGGDRNSNWEYDHDNDLWIQRTQFYNHRSGSTREGMVSFSFPSGRAFAGMGKGGTTHNEDMWEFIPLIDDDVYND